jgi:streptomycin 6-kinase
MNVFEKNIISIYQTKGRVWLSELPQQVERFKVLWGLSHLNPCDNLSYNYVLSGYQKEKPIILKLSCDALSLQTEARALLAFAGYGAVSVLEHQDNALLLERAMPGNRLKDHRLVGSRKSLEIACNVMEKLHKAPLPKESLFPHIRD